MIVSFHDWPTNGDMIADLDALGMIPEGPIFDVTYGRGGFWTKARRRDVITNDLRVEVGVATNFDFTKPFPIKHWGLYRTVAYDPPYKLNGTPTDDDRYGVDEKVSVKERIRRAKVGLYHSRFLLEPGGTMLVKTQNQIANGRYHDLVTDHINIARGLGLHTEAIMHLAQVPRPQRSQKRPRNNYSTLLVFTERGIA